MEILQVVGIGIIATILIITLKAQKPEMALQISIVAGIVIFMLIASKLSAVVQLLNSFAEKAKINTGYMSTLLKIIGIAYIVEFGAEICRDAGESSVATKIELAGKVTIVLLAVPIITSLLDLIMNLMP